MQTLDEKPETIHLYVVRETEPKPPILPIVLSALSLIVPLVYCSLIPYQQPEVRAVIRVPAVPLAIQTFDATVAIIPTGVKVYPATTAHGVLTITNGSVISQDLPSGMIFTGNPGISVITDTSVYVPAGSAEGFGMSTVSAHLLTSGINLSTLSVNQVVGTSLYVRNLQPFSGGKPAYSVKDVTSQDRQTALTKARGILALQITGLHYPCKETYLQNPKQITMTWRCQFLTYIVPSYMHVTGVTIQGKNLIISVWFIAPYRRTWAK
jgi:hypothetical protein